MQNITQLIKNGGASLGIEFGSTRIKAVLIDSKGTILATAGFDWENRFIDGIWTYSERDIWQGLQAAYKNLSQSVQQQYGIVLEKLQSIGISAMMHGYMPFNTRNELLVPFRTWRNNITSQAAAQLTELFQYNIPQRWSIAHLYQAILNQESHIQNITYLTTLSGYIHWQLTGEKVLGVGDASGMFPINIQSGTFDQSMMAKFNTLLAEKNIHLPLDSLFPTVLPAGKYAGKLTQASALKLDPTGHLQAGIPFCPPEGDAGTGMVATNAVREKTGNISAGTSAFAMIVLSKTLSKVYEQLDMVTTPSGKPVAMAHSNNCTSDINAWMNLFGECLSAFNLNVSTNQLYETLFSQALNGDEDCGNLLAYGFYSGEHGVGLTEGCPMFMHPMNARFNLANFMRVHLYTAFGAMKLGMDILLQREKVEIERILAHGGIFKTKNIAQRILAAALNTPIAVMNTAGEGGAWGAALLANYLTYTDDSLEDYLDKHIFAHTEQTVCLPDEAMSQGYQRFMQRYQQGISIVQQAIESRITKI
ncbi:FGGY-family carbohydrate kinase [Pasteurellaceae bacterium LIM206]|nr:FGGY-family carbohydrate kinase [Pasteurellaceae bacterium LIM206]